MAEQVNANSGRLDKLEDHAIKTNGRLDVIEATQASHGVKLDNIGLSLNNIAHSLVKYDSMPRFDLSKTVSIVRDIFAIGAVLSSLAVWFVLTMTSTNDKLTEMRVGRNEERINWLRDRWDYVPVPRTTIQPKGIQQ